MADEKVVYATFSTEKVEPVEPVKLTEDSQSKTFVDCYNGTLKYVLQFDKWYVYNSYYWEEISKVELTESARLLNRETAHTVKNARLQKTLSCRRFAQQVEAFSRGDERSFLDWKELDADPWLLGTPEGVIDLRTGRNIAMGLRPYVTMTTAVAPAVDDKSCPEFLEFMNEITCGDKELCRYLLQYAGYCLTGNMDEQCLLFLYGDGNNGKTVFIQLLLWLLGSYATTAAIEVFTTLGAGKHTTGLAALHRKRLVIANETQQGHTLRMDVIKGITGQDKIRANFMRMDTFEFLPVCKLIMFGNHMPSLPNVGKAEKKRIRKVPFNLQLEEHEIDKDLLTKLKAEGPGILRILLNSCLDWQAQGLVEPECVTEQTANYFYDQDTFSRWLEECCVVEKDKQCPTKRLWDSWRTWAKAQDVDTGDETAFSGSLTQRGFSKRKNIPGPDGKRVRGWGGLEVGEGDGPDFMPR